MAEARGVLVGGGQKSLSIQEPYFSQRLRFLKANWKGRPRKLIFIRERLKSSVSETCLCETNLRQFPEEKTSS